MPQQSDEEPMMFAEEDGASEQELRQDIWRMLIVDDEPDVHTSTKLALADVKILGRSLEFLHAYSAREATQLLRLEKDIALVLLDVVMESDDAGLGLVRTIRNELKLLELRIILHTGQPGYAPEIETIHDYDINDYKTKSELSRTRLYASVTSAVRAYHQIRALDQLAFYDRLCSLPNRNRFISLINERMAQPDHAAHAIAIVDIDDFAEINDALGHQHGDRLLQVIADRLSLTFGGEVAVARLGSDAFGILGPTAALDPERLVALFQRPFEMPGHTMAVTATSGLRHLSDRGISGLEAIKDANIALKRAKKSRRGHYMFFADEMGDEIRERVRLLQGLRVAMDSDRLFLMYQPQIRLDTGKLMGVEALVRWRNLDGQLVPPDRFIPLAECTGLIVNLGEWVMRMACHTLRQLNKAGRPPLRMSVNVSHIQFRNHAFPEMLAAALEDTGVDPSCVELEITESVAMEEPDFIVALLTRLKRMGVSIAIDDFGTGYSSLSQLRQLPVDRLKLDRAFVMGLSDSDHGGRIAATVVELGRNLNLTTIAEGIEEEGEARVLHELGCHEGQGYLYARPMELPALKEWIEAYEQKRSLVQE
ncbi:putative bifunctional diguanylate cyclase/phosphodiesterase [Variovorax sp. HJSM1_2]|uniref:putative bifunctional diguanylate cyclase/phosphodiesterase n=1 Tax=Variovorax sp. HJSM1_2 TaxID=3366263 RepID=UPI003BC09989